MSGKLTLDTDAGGSVTITVDDTETGDIEYPLDSAGIDSGVAPNVIRVQYPDGTMIYTGRAGVNIGVDIVFLTPFVGDYYITGSVVHTSEPSTSVAYAVDFYDFTQSGCGFGERFITSSQVGTGGDTINWQAIGRWK